jgi:hypothetical protein
LTSARHPQIKHPQTGISGLKGGAMRLTSRWIRVLFGTLALAAAIGSIAHVASLNAPQLLAEEGPKKPTGG